MTAAVVTYVWHDLDCDGFQDDDEPGIPDVTLELRRKNVVLQTLETDGDGASRFDPVRTGSYLLVVQDVPDPELEPTVCNAGSDRTRDSECSPVAFKLNEGGNNSLAFGFHYPPSSAISGRLWHDLDCDGLDDPGEPGLARLPVQLFSRDDFLDDGDDGPQLVADTFSDDSGNYLFPTLCQGEFLVVVDTPAGFLVSPCNVGGDDTIDNDCSPADVFLPDEQTLVFDVDFGFRLECCGGTASIGDRVWNDRNCDGIQGDPEEEPGRHDVRVLLLTANGDPFRETLTDTQGNYGFEGLCAGSYIVDIDTRTLPSDWEASIPCSDDGNEPGDSNCFPFPVTVVPDERNDTIDFGFHDPCCEGHGSLGDYVWFDADCDGLQDPEEDGIGNATVLVCDLALNLVATAVTDENGYWLVEGLCPDTYVVEVLPETLPTGYVSSPPEVGDDDSVDSNPNPDIVVVPEEPSRNVTIDFGFHGPCCGGRSGIGDRIWNDLDCDGIQDEREPGLSGVVVTLDTPSGDLHLESTTDEDGAYFFNGLCAGTYIIGFDPASVPRDFVLAPSDAGNDDDVDSDHPPVVVVLPDDKTGDRSVDIGFHSPCCSGRASIGNLVWNDINGNGCREEFEPGLDGVRLRLYTLDDVEFGVQWTSDCGAFSFDHLCAGTYRVEVDESTLPPGFVPSPCVCDNVCSPVEVEVPSDVYQTGQIDFGYHSACLDGESSVGDRTWFDANENGIFDGPDRTIGGITLHLYDEHGTLFGKTTTSDFGRYKFFGLCAGTYTIETFVPPSLDLEPTLCDVGDDDEIDSECSPYTFFLPADTVEFSIDFGFKVKE